MIEPLDALDLYKIPSDAVLKHRKEFYSLARRKNDQTKIWLNRVQEHIKHCKFPKLVEYLLIDRFVCELNRAEKNSIRAVAETWVLKQLSEYLGNGLTDTEHRDANEDECIDTNQDKPSIDIVKFEKPVCILVWMIYY